MSIQPYPNVSFIIWTRTFGTVFVILKTCLAFSETVLRFRLGKPSIFLVVSIQAAQGFFALCCLVIAILKCKLWPHFHNRQTPRICCCPILQEFQSDVQPNNRCQNVNAKFQSEKKTETNVISNNTTNADKVVADDGRNTLPCDLDMSVKARGVASGKLLHKSYFICLNCRLVQSPPPCLSSDPLGYVPRSNEEECHSDDVRRIVTGDLGRPALLEGVNATNLRHSTKSSKGRVEERGNGRCDVSCPHVSELDYGKVHQLLPEMEGCQVKYHQIFHDRNAAGTPRSVKMKRQTMKPSLCGHPSQRGGQVVLLDERKNISLQPENDLICKYTDCDKLGDGGRRMSEEPAQNVKFEEQKIQIDDTEGNSFLNDDNKLLSSRVSRTLVPKNVGFYIPNSKHKSSAAVVSAQRHVVQPCGPNPKSKYLLKLNNRPENVDHSEATEDPTEDTYGLGGQNLRRKEQDYLMVKVNLQPFRNKKVHPHRIPSSGGAQLHKRLHDASKAKSFKDAVVQTKYVNVAQLFKSSGGPDAFEGSRGLVSNSLTSDNIRDSQVKRGKKNRKKDLLPGDTANTPSLVSCSEKTDNILSPQTSILQSNLESASAKPSEAHCSNMLSEQPSLKSKVDHKGQISTEPSRKHAEHRDPEIQSGDERLTENKPSTKCENGDKPQTLPGTVLDTSLSAVVNGGISEEIEFPSRGDNASCEIDPGGFSSLACNEVIGHFQDNSTSQDNKPDGLCRDNNSVIDREINKATDKRVNNGIPLNDALLADSSSDKTKGNAEGESIMSPRLDNDVKNLKKEMELDNGEDDGALVSGEPGASDSTRTEDVGSKECVQAGDTLEENKLQNHKGGQQQDSQEPLEDGDKLCAYGDMGGVASEVKNNIFERQSQEGDLSFLIQKSQEPPTTTKDVPAQDNGESNSNNNHSSTTPPTEPRKQHLGLSESSKVIIILESIKETINIQKYLSERTANRDASSSRNESESSSVDGSQRKKICLILPEKPSANVSKSTHKKIK